MDVFNETQICHKIMMNTQIRWWKWIFLHTKKSIFCNWMSGIHHQIILGLIVKFFGANIYWNYCYTVKVAGFLHVKIVACKCTVCKYVRIMFLARHIWKRCIWLDASSWMHPAQTHLAKCIYSGASMYASFYSATVWSCT